MIKERFKVSWGPLPSTAPCCCCRDTAQSLCLWVTSISTFLGGQGFNDGLEELCKIQKAWAIPDMEQRDKIRQAQKNIVRETYGAFLHR